MANRTGRLFFALWPDQDVRGRILTVSEPWRTALRCRWTPPEKLHLTLAFLGDVAVEQLPVLEAIGQSLRADAPLVVTFGRLELWPRPQLLCLVGDTPEPLRGLVKALNRGLAAEGFAIERRPYRPHLTLARHARRLPEDMTFEPIRWPASTVQLVESRPDLPAAPYRCLKAWDLIAAGRR